LEEAIICHREALTYHPRGHPSRSTSLSGLANSVFTRFQQSGKMENLDEAITCHREALVLCPHGHPNRAASLNNLASAVATRFGQSGRMEDLEEAISYRREALALCPHGHPDRSASLNNLAGSLWTRFEQSRNKDDLLDSLKYLSEAKTLLPIDHPRHTIVGTSLASFLCYFIPKSDGSLSLSTSKAFDLFKQAANHPFASAKARFQAAVQWAREARRCNHRTTVHTYAKSLSLLDRCLLRSSPSKIS